ncbi:MAG: hypothetical protein KDG50_12320 [Chromatiales bacterium]|nr:hypothetical protein [Chromatiales bacterium]
MRSRILRLAGAVCIGIGFGCASLRAMAESDSPFNALFEASLASKKGVIVYVNGQSIPGRVTRMPDGHTVELANREYDRIVVRLDRIDAVAGNP